MKSFVPDFRNLLAIVFLFVLTGTVVGVLAGAISTGQNGYFDREMLEILFWNLAKTVRHHLAIFTRIAAAGLALYGLLRLATISPPRAVSFGLLPLSALGILYFYGRPYWVIYRASPDRLVGKTEVVVYLVVLVLLMLFFIAWYAGLRKIALRAWRGRFESIVARPLFFLVLCAVPASILLLDRIDWSKRADPAWNVIVISLDTLRADRLGCYGYPKAISPNIDAFAAGCVQFNRAISPSSWTLPVHASLFTGFYPSIHGAVDRRRGISRSHLMLAEILRNAGYKVMALTGGGYLNPIYGFGQGFDEYGHLESLDSERIWEAVDAGKDIPFFLFLHTYRIHNYYVPDDLLDRVDPAHAERFQDLVSIMSFVDRYRLEDLDDTSREWLGHLVSRYDMAIFDIDRQFGTMMRGLEERGRLDDTLIILLSDHGEEFGEHDRTFHGGTLYQEQVHIPLLIRLPGQVTEEREVDEIVELMDVFPTILELLGLPVPPGLDAQSLLPRIEGGGMESDGIAFSEISSLVTERYAVCTNSMKLIYSPISEHLPLPGDGGVAPYTLTWGPEWSERPALGEAAALAAPLREWYERMARRRAEAGTGDEIVIDPELREELKALGYVQ
jgi:hypothetical protein